MNQYLTYNEKYTSSSYDMTPVEIYYLRTGASRHFTLLYNALLNAIDIKTLTIVGWAFKRVIYQVIIALLIILGLRL